jgi:SAM-dependent methyltransferase
VHTIARPPGRVEPLPTLACAHARPWRRPRQAAWAGYYQWNRDRPVRELLGRALAAYGEVAGGAVALDLGCGTGRETRALLDAAFAVTAVDVTPVAIEIVSAFPEAGTSLTPVLSAMQNAVLPFCPPQDFDRLWSAVRDAVRPGGLLAVDLFGTRDDWAGEPGMTFVDRARIDALTAGLDVVWFDEVDQDGRAYAGPKHWHRFEVVGRRPG